MTPWAKAGWGTWVLSMVFLVAAYGIAEGSLWRKFASFTCVWIYTLIRSDDYLQD